MDVCVCVSLCMCGCYVSVLEFKKHYNSCGLLLFIKQLLHMLYFLLVMVKCKPAGYLNQHNMEHVPASKESFYLLELTGAFCELFVSFFLNFH